MSTYNTKIIKNFFVIITSVFFLASCVFTPELYKEHSYKESFSSILLSKDGNHLVVASPNFHYIFDTPPTLRSTFKSSYGRKVKARFGEFGLFTSNKITGRVYLELLGATPEESKSAQDSGYRKKNKHVLTARVEMKGKRYRPRKNSDISTHYQLNKKYNVKVNSAISLDKHLARIALTPLVLTADGIFLVAGGVILAPIILTFLAADLQR